MFLIKQNKSYFAGLLFTTIWINSDEFLRFSSEKDEVAAPK